jgi:hypothetical protein
MPPVRKTSSKPACTWHHMVYSLCGPEMVIELLCLNKDVCMLSRQSSTCAVSAVLANSAWPLCPLSPAKSIPSHDV